MAVPKRRTSPSKRNMRRANHDRVVAPNLSSCQRCQEPLLSHQICPTCGYYKGRAMINKRTSS
ncbi:50S ribosomal protein L32 [Pajaroellobacter abortibovis]|uniref:50S ribosomal protein L32 n=1 Tax=Pajaroellobacter abortibovis TaxID=1882918 RepID=UPI00094B1A3B|nr:50S ribosomal protein L32 [Pajaroellobacter abortibovis]